VTAGAVGEKHTRLSWDRVHSGEVGQWKPTWMSTWVMVCLTLAAGAARATQAGRVDGRWEVCGGGVGVAWDVRAFLPSAYF
jgi:hypothetical protein